MCTGGKPDQHPPSGHPVLEFEATFLISVHLHRFVFIAKANALATCAAAEGHVAGIVVITQGGLVLPRVTFRTSPHLCGRLVDRLADHLSCSTQTVQLSTHATIRLRDIIVVFFGLEETRQKLLRRLQHRGRGHILCLCKRFCCGGHVRQCSTRPSKMQW